MFSFELLVYTGSARRGEQTEGFGCIPFDTRLNVKIAALRREIQRLDGLKGN